MASFNFKTKPIPKMFLGVDGVTPEYECTPSDNRLRGIWVYIGGTAHYFACDQYTICNPVEATEDGRRQAIVLMNEIFDMTGSERKEAFGKVTRDEIIRDASYEDLAKKLDNWKKGKEKIHIKDEVVQKLDSRLKFVVTEVHDGSGDTYISGVSKDGKVYPGHNIKNYKKTGLHVDDLDAYLEV